MRKIPGGFEYLFNNSTKNWVYRPIKGYSEKFLNEESFIPKDSNFENDTFENENSRLYNAKKRKNDEFYTRYKDIEEELKYYNDAFRDKIVYCPCDSVFNMIRSNFFNYFANNFHKLGLKRLICTLYNPNGETGYKWVYNGEMPDNTYIDESDIDIEFLNGKGSFDEKEFEQIMEECDIIVTNPPFSEFKTFISKVIHSGKKFLVIGNKNGIALKDIFFRIKNNEIWVGCTSPRDFKQPSTYVKRRMIDLTKWYTNIEHSKRNTDLKLTKTYNEIDYPKYDNYNAINVNKVSDIPSDYNGYMGVPITYIDKYNPKQFEIIWQLSGNTKKNAPKEILDMLEYKEDKEDKGGCGLINGKRVFNRIVIKKL